MDESPFFDAMIARDGSVIISKTSNAQRFFICPEILYTIIEEMLASETIEVSRRDGNITVIKFP